MNRRFEIDPERTPNRPGIMLVIIEALIALGGSASNNEIDEKVIELEGVTEEEQKIVFRDNSSKLHYYLGWARTFLKHGDALANSSRGVWVLTEKGSAITKMEETTAILKQFEQEKRKRVRSDRQGAQTVTGGIIEPADDGPEEAEEWKSSLLAVLNAMQPDSFERLSQRLLREAGFIKVEVRGKSGDGGIDGIGVLRVGLVSFQIYFQCKRWKGSVGPKEIRDFRGALQGRSDKGLFITTGNFTKNAIDEAVRDGAIAIDLIDGNRLCDLLKEYGLGTETRKVERVSIKPDWFESV